MNKKSLLLYGGAAAGLGLLFSGGMLSKKKTLVSTSNSKSLKKQEICKTVPEYMKPLVPIVGEDAVCIISTDPIWSELCDRASEFYVLCKDEFKEFLMAVAGVVAFQISLRVNEEKITLGVPRKFRVKLHAVVESVRLMRAAVEDRCSSAIDDFDEVAAEIQRTHDDFAYNMQLEASNEA